MERASVCNKVVMAVALLWSGFAFAPEASAQTDGAAAAQAYRRVNPVVVPQGDGSILCEAEEFQVQTPGWQAQNWGANYYAATFANCFLSRKAFLGAPAQCDQTVATIQAQVPQAGRYLALVRYEAAYRFETQFRLRVEQNGKVLLDRLYGARDNVKIWAFGERLKKETAWYWGAVENVVWEGHDAYVELQPGAVTLTLIAGPQQGNAAKRNVDLVLLTTDEADVQQRINGEGYLPLDGLLTQAGDVYLRLHNEPDGSPMTMTVSPCTQHSPYWVHMRKWVPRKLTAAAGQSTDWVEVGSLLDSLNDGQWGFSAAPQTADAPLHYRAEFGVKTADGQIESIRTFESRASGVQLAYDANTRYSRRLRPAEEVLYDLLAYLKARPVRGQAPRRTLVICYSFDERPDDPKYTAARDEFIQMMGLTGLAKGDIGIPNGHTDVRGQGLAQLEEFCKKLQADGEAENMAVVSLGDEIGLGSPPADDHDGFRQWLQDQGLNPADVDPAAGAWDHVVYSPAGQAAQDKPGLYYYSQRYRHHYGIQGQKGVTDVLRRYLPNAGIGANYSPHMAAQAYLGETHMWVTVFRRGGMTMPWGEDYIWQVPMGTQQMNFINLDLFRAGIKGKPDAKILYYVMPHWPGNTPNSWRRQFYGDVAHGMKIVDLFEFRPVQAAYTENHCSLPEMYLEVRRSFYEMGLFEDIMQDGQVEPGTAALWFSETGDIWGDRRNPFSAGKRALYIAILHQQLPLDFVIEEDALAGDLKQYNVLYLTDGHVSRAASRAIADWVAAGGRLFATAGAGMLDELNEPNETMRNLLGVRQIALDETAEIRFIKQDLPFVEPMDTVTWKTAAGELRLPAFSARSRIQAAGAEVQGTFADGSPAITVKPTGRGRAVYCAFLPGLSYFRPAIPLRPMDRGSTDDAMSHFIPTQFDPAAAALLAASAGDVERPVACSEPLVEARIVRAPQGVLIPLVNWSGGPIGALTVRVRADVPTGQVTLAGGGPVEVGDINGERVFTLDLDVADALILR